MRVVVCVGLAKCFCIVWALAKPRAVSSHTNSIYHSLMFESAVILGGSFVDVCGALRSRSLPPCSAISSSQALNKGLKRRVEGLQEMADSNEWTDEVRDTAV